MRGRLGVWAGLGLAVAAGTALGSLAGTRVNVTSPERSQVMQETWHAQLSRRLAAVDAAVAAQDPTRAIYEWRDAYGLALGTRQWEALVSVGDAALRIDALAGLPSRQPTGFRAEARQAYLLALFQARDAGARDGVERVAGIFAALGDVEMAGRARAILARVSR
jgi:hypothetical protein